MRKRIAIVVIPSFILVAVLVALILNQFSSRLPPEGQQALDAYVESHYPDVVVTTILYAHNRERFTVDMGRYLSHAPDTEYRISPVLYDDDIIRQPEESAQFPFPAQQVWCVTLTRPNKTADLFFLARHDNLYGESWALYESRIGRQPPKSIGCGSP
jgi:hypothetical protein